MPGCQLAEAEAVIEVQRRFPHKPYCLVRQWALAGYGIAYKSRLDVQDDLDAGRLVDLFPDALYDSTPLYVAYPSRRYQPARLKALLDYLLGTFG